MFRMATFSSLIEKESDVEAQPCDLNAFIASLQQPALANFKARRELA